MPMRLHLPTITVILASAALATACGSSPSSAPAVHPATRICKASQLKIALTHSAVAAGNIGGYLGFTNTSGSACRLTGWPILVGVTASGSTSRAATVLTTMFGPFGLKAAPVVTLKPRALAEAAFQGSDVPKSDSVCPPSYRYLRVTPPGSTSTVQLSAFLPTLGTYMPACRTPIVVSPVVPSADLYKP